MAKLPWGHAHEVWFEVLTGAAPVPDHMYLTKECVNQHGVAGKTLRFKSNRQCAYCQAEAHRRMTGRRYSMSNAVHDAAHLRDELLLQRQLKEVWE